MTWQKIRQDFPILEERLVRGGKKLHYLDSAATTLKPNSVVDAVEHHLRMGASNIHRGVHALSEEATAAYEQSREKVRAFIGARDGREIIFTSGTTHAINLVAHGYGNQLAEGDEVVITYMEHHSNIVPWQMLRERRGIVLKVAPINDRGELLIDEMRRLITPRTKLVSMVYVSNALGTINPVDKVIAMARQVGAKVLLDAAQAVAHLPIDVAALDCDFLAFSGHKLLGPTGVGVLYGKQSLLEAMPPLFGGGDMIRSVSFDKTTYADLPARHEAGTPPIAEVIGLGAAIDYIQGLGLGAIRAREEMLLEYGTRRLAQVPGLRLIGTAEHKAAILAFVLDEVHPHDLGTILDSEGVAIRAGHHCTQPLMARFGVPATARASLAFYNDEADLEALVAALHKARSMFQ